MRSIAQVYINGIYKHEPSETYWVLYRDPFHNARLVELHVMISADTDEQLFMGGIPASVSDSKARFIGFNSFGEDSFFKTSVGTFTIGALHFTDKVLVGAEYLRNLQASQRRFEVVQQKAKEFFSI
jgi:hypothetical protein